MGAVEVRAHELAVAFLLGGVMGVVAYFLTRQIEGPISRAIDAIGS